MHAHAFKITDEGAFVNISIQSGLHNLHHILDALAEFRRRELLLQHIQHGSSCPLKFVFTNGGERRIYPPAVILADRPLHCTAALGFKAADQPRDRALTEADHRLQLLQPQLFSGASNKNNST